jgi:signal peptidase II
MGRDAQGGTMNGPYLIGPRTALGFAVAVITCALDQATKLWLVFWFELGKRGSLEIGPFIDLVLTWNTGISYGWFRQEGPLGQWVLLGIKFVAVAFLWVWLARTTSRHSGLALGLIIGGAVGNAIDRFIHGAVADFVLFHITTQQWSFNWYVFNLADAAIVAGVVGILYESVVGERAVKAP